MISQRIWTRQPTVPCAVAHSALAEGLIFASYPLGTSYYDAVTGLVSVEASPSSDPMDPPTVLQQQTFASGGRLTCRPGEWIYAPRAAAGHTNSGQVFPQRTRFDNYSGPITLMCLGGFNAGGGNSAHFMFGSGGSGSVSFAGIGIDDGTSTGNNNGTIGAAFYHAYDASALSTSGFQTGALGTNNTCKNRLHFFGCSCDDAGSAGGATRNFQFYYHSDTSGFFVDQQTGPTYFRDASDRLTYIGTNASGGWGGSVQGHMVGLALVWSRILTLSEFVLLWHNPWRVLAQRAPIVPALAAGGAVRSRWNYDMLLAA